MKATTISAVLAAATLVPTALFAQKAPRAPSVSEIVVTKDLDISSSNLLSRPANARLLAALASGHKLAPVDVYVDPELIKRARAAAPATGKTLAAEVMARDHFKSVKITIRNGGSDGAAARFFNEVRATAALASLTIVMKQPRSRAEMQVYLEIKLTDALISGYQVSAGADRPTESLSINFTKIEFKYTPYDDQHKAD